jgi:hypothetical protein
MSPRSDSCTCQPRGFLMKQTARVIHRTRPHLITLLQQISAAAARDKSNLVSVVGEADESLILKVGGVSIFFRAAYELDGRGYLESGHHEWGERGEQISVTDLSLAVDQYGNVEQHYTVEEVAAELDTLLDRTYESMRKGFSGKQVRIIGGIFEVRDDDLIKVASA